MRKSITAPGRETEKEFIRLSREALEEQDRDKLIDLLMERNKLFTDHVRNVSTLLRPRSAS
jgi:hypothetical protein